MSAQDENMPKVRRSVTISEETIAWFKEQIKKKRFKDVSHANAIFMRNESVLEYVKESKEAQKSSLKEVMAEVLAVATDKGKPTVEKLVEIIPKVLPHLIIGKEQIIIYREQACSSSGTLEEKEKKYPQEGVLLAEIPREGGLAAPEGYYPQIDEEMFLLETGKLLGRTLIEDDRSEVRGAWRHWWKYKILEIDPKSLNKEDASAVLKGVLNIFLSYAIMNLNAEDLERFRPFPHDIMVNLMGDSIIERKKKKEVALKLGKEPLEAFMDILKSGKDPYFAFIVAETCGEEAVEPLILALRDEEFRAGAIETLGKIGDEKAIIPLIKLLRDEAAGALQAAEALSNFRSDIVVEPLIEALIETDSVSAKITIIEALSKISDERATEPLLMEIPKILNQKGLFKNFMPFCFGVYSGGEGRSRLATVVKALRNIDDERAFILLLKADKFIPSESDFPRFDEAILRLESRLTSKSTEPLIEAIENNEVTLNRAINALGKINDEHAIEYLTHLYLENKDPIKKELAGKQLDKLGKRPKSWREKLFGQK